MEESTSVVPLFRALSKAQGSIKKVVKNAKNPHYGSEYADLSAITDAIRKPLKDNGLSVVEDTELIEIVDGFWTISMTLTVFHESGASHAICASIPAAGKNRLDAQTVGAAITYGRRYLLQNMFNIAAEPDDDGNSLIGAQEPSGRPERASKGTTTTKPKKTVSNAADTPLTTDYSFKGVVNLVNGATKVGIPQRHAPAIMRLAIKEKENPDMPWETFISRILDSVDHDEWGWLEGESDD